MNELFDCASSKQASVYSPSQDEPNTNYHSPLGAFAFVNLASTVQYKTALDESWSSF
ncbi:MAG: hypothetical protein RM049_38510 [Nostoc sp. DedQUE04]|uniref:hypothetical protein n=1 Tax=Nostoc sp. DedQUE04 TaxID=3075390 RepID=UPI002AD224D6|nr:hypothetical protein [Nostoc sp. DedQUE04]MDZ8141115.1 hypothetical protein [Nostoc sp. DedQUE04]